MPAWQAFGVESRRFREERCGDLEGADGADAAGEIFVVVVVAAEVGKIEMARDGRCQPRTPLALRSAHSRAADPGSGQGTKGELFCRPVPKAFLIDCVARQTSWADRVGYGCLGHKPKKSGSGNTNAGPALLPRFRTGSARLAGGTGGCPVLRPIGFR